MTTWRCGSGAAPRPRGLRAPRCDGRVVAKLVLVLVLVLVLRRFGEIKDLERLVLAWRGASTYKRNPQNLLSLGHALTTRGAAAQCPTSLSPPPLSSPHLSLPRFLALSLRGRLAPRAPMLPSPMSGA